MKPIDMIPGFAPVRTECQIANGWQVTVRPPAIIGGNGVTVTMNDDQYRRYHQWRAGALMIQDALPDLTDSQREALMTGLSDDEFARAAGDD